MRRRSGFWLAVVFVVIVLPVALSAHLRLTKSSPVEGATLASPPKQLQLWFNEEPLLPLTSITLTGPNGAVKIDPPRAAVERSLTVAVGPRSRRAPIASHGRPPATTAMSSRHRRLHDQRVGAAANVTLDPSTVAILTGSARALVYGSAALIVGAAVFDAGVLATRRSRQTERDAARSRARQIALAAAAGLMPRLCRETSTSRWSTVSTSRCRRVKWCAS